MQQNTPHETSVAVCLALMTTRSNGGAFSVSPNGRNDGWMSARKPGLVDEAWFVTCRS